MATKPKNDRNQPAPAADEAAQQLEPYDADAGALDGSNKRNVEGKAGQHLSHLAERLGLSQQKLRKELRLPGGLIRQERLDRVEQVLARAQDAFDGSDVATEWIVQRNRALGGVTPLSLLDSESGYQLILDTLGRIEYGVIS